MAPVHRRLSLILLLALVMLALPAPQPLAAQSEITVTNLTDVNVCESGNCSLRGAINLANTRSGADRIRFADGLMGEIVLTGNLPALTTDGTTIDATSASAPYTPRIQINAAGVNPIFAYGLRILSNDNVIRGLTISRVGLDSSVSADQSGAGIIIEGGDRNQIYNCWIGLERDGSAHGNAGYGILLKDGASNNIIGANNDRDRNVISANLQAGIVLVSEEVSPIRLNEDNLIDGNYIGTNTAGTARLTDADTERKIAGIYVRAGTNRTTISNNVIGGMFSSQTFIISAGIYLTGFGTVSLTSTLVPDGTRIIANHIGVSRGGNAIANRIGVAVGGAGSAGPNNTVIGDPSVSGSGNIIAGNTRNAISLSDTTVPWGNVTIAGNRIGMTSGGALLPNGSTEAGSAGIFVGINTPLAGAFGRATIGPGNLIVASDLFGMRVRSGGHTIKGNLIGTDTTGTSSTLGTSPTILGTANGAASIFLENGQGVTIGGPTAADRNIIASSNSSSGGGSFAILVNPAAVNVNACGGTCVSGGHTIEGNYLGVGAGGVSPLRTTGTPLGDGIRLARTSGNTIRNNLIGGLTIGIVLGLSTDTSSADSNQIIGNIIGAPASGEIFFSSIPGTTDLETRAPRNRQEGIKIVRGTGNLLRGNLIAYNGSNTSITTVYPGVRVGDNNIIIGSTTAAANNQLIANRLVRNNENTSPDAGGGIIVDLATGVLLSQNTTQFHRGRGTVLLRQGNLGLAPPSFTLAQFSAATPGQPARLSGSTDCGAGCRVEIFTSSLSSEDFEGPLYVTSGLTTTGGAFTINLPFCQAYLTATVTDSNNNSSSYSEAIGSIPAGSCDAASFELVQASPNQRDVAPGSSWTYNHTLRHTAQVTLTYNLFISSNRGWASGPTQVTLPPGTNVSTVVPITVNVPANAATGTLDTTTVRAGLGTVVSNQVQTLTTARVPVVTPATPSLSAPLNLNQGSGGQTTFSYTLTNIGEQAGTFLVSTPSFSGTPPSGWTFGSGAVTPTSVSLAAGASTTLTIVATTPGSPRAGTYSFSFVVSVQGANPARTVSLTDTITVPVVRSFTLTPTAAQSAISLESSTLSFVYTLTNTGNAPDSFTLTTPNPTPVTSPALSFLDVTTSRALSNVPIGTAVTITLRYRVPTGAVVGDYTATLTAQTSGGTGGPTPATRTMNIEVVGGAVLSITPGEPTPASVGVDGGTMTFTNTVRNIGSAAAPVTVASSFGGLPPGWSADIIANDCPVPPAPLGIGASCTYSVEVSVPDGADGGVTRLTTSATADNSANAPAPNYTGTAELAVTVTRTRGLELTPDGQSALAGPGDWVSFEFTLTNTGNAADSYDLSLTQSATPAWTQILTPTSLLADVPRNGTATISVSVRMPAGLEAGFENLLSLRATAIELVGEPSPSDEVTASVVVDSILAGELEPGGLGNVDAGQALTYSLLVTNTGTVRSTYQLALSNDQPGWTAELLNDIPELAPGASTSLQIRVTAPPEAEAGLLNITSLRLLPSDGMGDPLDQTTITTRIGPRFGLTLTPDYDLIVAPGSTVVVTHTLRNIGSEVGTFRLRTGNAQGWETLVSPSEVSLAPDEEAIINVTIRVGLPVSAGDRALAVLFAELIADPTFKQQAKINMTIDLIAALDLESSQVRSVTPESGQISLTSLTLRNNGSAADTATLEVLGASDGWQVILERSRVPVPQYNSVGISLSVRVPPNIVSGTVKDIRVTACSELNPTVCDSVLLTLVYVAPPQPEELPLRYVYLPLVRR